MDSRCNWSIRGSFYPCLNIFILRIRQVGVLLSFLTEKERDLATAMNNYSTCDIKGIYEPTEHLQPSL